MHIEEELAEAKIAAAEWLYAEEMENEQNEAQRMIVDQYDNNEHVIGHFSEDHDDIVVENQDCNDDWIEQDQYAAGRQNQLLHAARLQIVLDHPIQWMREEAMYAQEHAAEQNLAQQQHADNIVAALNEAQHLEQENTMVRTTMVLITILYHKNKQQQMNVNNDCVSEQWH